VSALEYLLDGSHTRRVAVTGPHDNGQPFHSFRRVGLGKRLDVGGCLVQRALFPAAASLAGL
jgi:hypothetical protein